MKSHLPDHPQIYVPIRLRCNHVITYTYHTRLYIAVQVLGRYQTASTKVSINFHSQWSTYFVDRTNTSSDKHAFGWLTSKH